MTPFYNMSITKKISLIFIWADFRERLNTLETEKKQEKVDVEGNICLNIVSNIVLDSVVDVEGIYY